MNGRIAPKIAVGAAVTERGVGSDLRFAMLSRRLTLQEAAAYLAHAFAIEPPDENSVIDSLEDTRDD